MSSERNQAAAEPPFSFGGLSSLTSDTIYDCVLLAVDITEKDTRSWVVSGMSQGLIWT
jgi:hypothetical protein